MNAISFRSVPRLAVAVLAFAAATAVTLALWDAVFHRVPFALYFAAVALAAWRAGWVAGMAVGLAGLLTIAVHQRFAANLLVPSVVLLGVSGVISLLAATRERALTSLRELAGKLERQGRTFAQIATATPDFIYVFDREGRFLYANRRLLEVWGRTLEDALGKDLYELGYPKWHADMHVRELRQVIETRQPVKGEVPFTGGSGISGVYEYIFTPVIGASGEVEVIAGTTRDVTERKRVETELAAANAVAEAGIARWRAVVENMAEGVILADGNGASVEWNPSALRMHGYASAEEMRRTVSQARPPFELTKPDGTVVPIERWPVMRLLGGESFTNWEVRLRRLDMPLDRTVRYSGAAIRDRYGGIDLVVLTLHDVTEERRLQDRNAQLLEGERAARAEAERASRMKEEFLSVVSHELRTPLSAILGWSQILAPGDVGSDDLKEGLAVIQRNARMQTQIIEDILDMSRIVSGKVRLDVQRVDLPAVIEAAVESMQPAADAKGIRLQKVLDPLAGPVSGDPNRLQQVVWNLLSNAIKFTPKDGRVRVTLARVNSHVEISVSDTGEGIKPDFLPHVFDRFRQGDGATTRRHGGLGLGLSITKHLVELHGGTVEAASPGEGKGATFRVALPLTPLHAVDEHDLGRQHPRSPDSSNEGGPPAPQTTLSGRKVLVVDDEPDARALIKRLLEDREAEVTLASTVEEAFAAVRHSPFDVIVSDIGMPHRDGYELVRMIRSLSPAQGGRTPAVALTAFARSEDRTRAVMAGFDIHVAKPVEPSELCAVVARLARRAEPEPSSSPQ